MTIHEKAADIAKQGLNFVADGRKLMQIIDELGAEFLADEEFNADTTDKLELKEWLFKGLHLLDRRYRWTHKYMTQDQEEDVFEMFVDIWFRAKELGMEI